MNQKLPGKTMVWVFMGVCVALVFIIGFGIGFGSAGGAGDLCQGAENCQEGGVRTTMLDSSTNIENAFSDSSLLLLGEQQ